MKIAQLLIAKQHRKKHLLFVDSFNPPKVPVMCLQIKSM